MTIRVFPNRIEFNGYTLTVTPTGASFDGSVAASSYSSGFKVGQGNSYAFKGGLYKFGFASDNFATEATSGLVPATNRNRGTCHSSETHGYTTTGSVFPETSLNLIETPAALNTLGYNQSTIPPVGPTSPSGVLTPISRFSFSSQAGAEDIGTWTVTAAVTPSPSTSLKLRRQGSVTFPRNMGFSSKSDGYILPGFHPRSAYNAYTLGLYKFSFTSAVNKAVIGRAAAQQNEDMFSPLGQIGNPSDNGPSFSGSALSTENFGYCVESASTKGPINNEFAFYKKFPFATESTLALIYGSAGIAQNRSYMTGITGPNAGYWVSGLNGIYEGTGYGVPTFTFPTEIPHPHFIPGAQGTNIAHKFPFATDTLSVIDLSPFPGGVGFGSSGTASSTNGYLLNGLRGIPPASSFGHVRATWYPSPTEWALRPGTFPSTYRAKFPFASESTMSLLPASAVATMINTGNHQY
jgi:hypothetical protein